MGLEFIPGDQESHTRTGHIHTPTRTLLNYHHHGKHDYNGIDYNYNGINKSVLHPLCYQLKIPTTETQTRKSSINHYGAECSKIHSPVNLTPGI